MRRSGIVLVTQHSDLPEVLRGIGRTVVATVPGSVARAIERALSIPGVRVVGVVLGRLEEPAKLGALSERARRAGKSIVALALGMPIEHEAVLGALGRQHCLGVATSLDSLLDACVALASSGRPRGPRVAIVGARAAVAGDLAAVAARKGLDLMPHGPSSERALRSADVVGLVGGGARAPMAGGPKRTIVRAVIPAPSGRGTTRGLIPGGERLVEVLRILQTLGRGKAKAASAAAPRPTGIDPAPARAVLEGPARVLSEPSSKRALAPYGIVFPREVLSKSASMAEQAARTMRPPLTAKIASPDLLDKLDGKGIIRQISNGTRARAAFHALTRDALRARADARILGVLLSETVEGIAEVRLRAVRDPALGLLVQLGGSGISELTLPRDPVLLLPASRADVVDFVAIAPVSRLYDGSSGRERGDQRALATTIVHLAAFLSDMADQVSEVILAPVVVRARGQGVVVTDARVSVSPRPSAG